MARRKWIAGLLALPVLGYGAACGWMYAKQRELMYFPQATRVDAAQTDFGIARNGVMLNGWLLNAGQPRAVIYFGGNAERIESMRDEFARWFPGSSVYLVPYRGFGASEGEPSEAALFEDALAVYDQVRARQPGAQRVRQQEVRGDEQERREQQPHLHGHRRYASGSVLGAKSR